MNQLVSFQLPEQKRKTKQSRKNFYLHELCCFISVESNSFSWLDGSSNFAFTGASSSKCKRFFTYSKAILAAIVSNFSIDGGTARKRGRPP